MFLFYGFHVRNFVVTSLISEFSLMANIFKKAFVYVVYTFV